MIEIKITKDDMEKMLNNLANESSVKYSCSTVTEKPRTMLFNFYFDDNIVVRIYETFTVAEKIEECEYQIHVQDILTTFQTNCKTRIKCLDYETYNKRISEAIRENKEELFY